MLALLARAVIALLTFLSSIYISIGHFIGWLYTKWWGQSRLHYFDHHFDHLRAPNYIYWQERGILGNRTIPQDGVVLDLCCGDGFYSIYYYSLRASHIDALDWDAPAIRAAKRRNRKPQIHFQRFDVNRQNFPRTDYDVVTLFSAIEHFSVEEGTALLRKIGVVLKPGGVLVGSTPIFSSQGGHNEEHQNEFLSIEQLQNFLSPHFRKVELWTSPWTSERLECYFECREPILRNSQSC